MVRNQRDGAVVEKHRKIGRSWLEIHEDVDDITTGLNALDFAARTEAPYWVTEASWEAAEYSIELIFRNAKSKVRWFLNSLYLEYDNQPLWSRPNFIAAARDFLHLEGTEIILLPSSKLYSTLA